MLDVTFARHVFRSHQVRLSHGILSFSRRVAERVRQVDRVLRSSLPGGAAPPPNHNGPPLHETQCTGALTSGKTSCFTLRATLIRNVQMAQHAPTALLLHSLTARLARRLLGSYKIHTPELNAAPMLWRVVRALGGSRE
jgi:hypothetical protein